MLAVVMLAGDVLEGDTQAFDEWVLSSLRTSGDMKTPVGPRWLELAAQDLTALGGPTVLGLTVAAIAGFLALQGLWRHALFIAIAAGGGWVLNDVLKAIVARPRPSVVPHLREVMSLSFPSGHALTSAVVFLTLGALLMRVCRTRLAAFYCMFVAMLASLLVGSTRVYLGVHYPTDVIAGWLIGLSWAICCWLVLRVLERRGGRLGQERADAQRS